MAQVIPCAPGAHIGEMITRDFLRKRLAEGYVILTNYHLPEANATLEIDLVVLTYYGVYLLEVKHWWGKIEADQTHWLQAGKRHPSPLTSIDTKAKVLHSTLAQARPDLARVSVVGFVVLSKGDALLEIDDPRADRVFTLDERLLEALTSEAYQFRPGRGLPLDRRRMEAVLETLLHQHVDPERRIVGSYEILEELPSGEGYDAFLAQHIDIRGRQVRLKRYHVPEVQSQRHLQESVRQFKQDMEALSQVDTHPNVVRAYDFFKDPDVDDTYYLALELVEGRTLRRLIDADEEVTLDESLRTLAPVADALAYAHERGIVHRNLTPRAVYVTEEGQVKVGDFDFARVPAIGMTISHTDEPLVVNKYVAPEQLENPRTAGAPADTYSMGAVWYDLLFQRPQDEAIRHALIARSDLPDLVKQLLRELLSTDPAERPTAHEVQQWFEMLAGELES
jgi:tRNA A-37 threonylcarbamoyl transferase component Bud32